MLLLDAGDALSQLWPSAISEQQRPGALKRAEFLLDQLGAQGYAVLAVGERDLVFPIPELVKRAEALKITLLAANLVDAEGKHPFKARTIVSVGGRKVGVFAVVDAVEFEKAGLKVTLPGEAAQEQASALRKEGADAVVGILHVNYDVALQIANALKDADYLIQAHVGRPVASQAVGQAILVGAGQRGQQLGRAVLTLDGQGPLFDMSEADNARAQLAEQEKQVSSVSAQVQKSTKEDRPQQEKLLEAVKRRRDELKAKAEAKSPSGRRTVRTDSINLNAQVPDDPAVKKAQDAVLAAAPVGR